MFKDDERLTEAGAEVRGIDRRTIAKGVAWSVPVVIVATAAPAAAASGVGVGISATRSGGTITFTITNNGAKPATVELTLIDPGSGWDLKGAKVTIPSGQTKTIVVTDRAPTAQYLTVSYTLDTAGYSQAVYVSSSVSVP